MINKKQTSIIFSTIILSFIILLSIKAIDNEFCENNRANLTNNINSSINEEISSKLEDKIESQLKSQQKNWGFSYVEYNPQSGIISNSTIRNGELIESFEVIKN